MGEDQHVYHHSDKSEPTVKIKLEKNTKGYNWEIAMEFPADDVQLSKLAMLNDDMRKLYGEPVTA